MYRFRRKKDNYIRLKRKLFWQTFLMMSAAYAGIWMLYLYVLHGKFATGVVAILQFLTGWDYVMCLGVYRDVFRNNFQLFIFAGAAGLFFVIFRVFLNWFTRYFSEIDRGVDCLIGRGEQEIRMSGEMEPMERKLNQVRQTLEQQFLEIRGAEEKKDELVMYLAHDIRTPLTSVIGYLSLLQEMPDMTEEQRQTFIRITLEKAQRLEVLVNEFFDITRFRREEAGYAKEKIDLFYMFLQLKEEAYPLLARKNMSITLDVAENCTVRGNPDRLARVFHNLLKNAVAYGDRDSEIVISAAEEENDTIITFSNYGPEISQAEQERLFDKFYRMDGARGTDSGGAGLGLAIAKELVGMHGGTIGVTSSGGYTTFRIALPAGE